MSPEELGFGTFKGTEIRSSVAGLTIVIRSEHVQQAIKGTAGGNILRSSQTDILDPKIQEELYCKGSQPKTNTDLKPFYRIVYKILHESITTKVGSSDHVSFLHKSFMYYIGQKVKINFARLLFDHLVESIGSTIDQGTHNIHHCRLLSYMFAQCGLLKAVKSSFPGFVGYFDSYPPLINGHTLKNIRIIKAGTKIITPNHPRGLRKSEPEINSLLIPCPILEASKIAQEHKDFLVEKGYTVEEPSEKQLRIPLTKKIPKKRKTADQKVEEEAGSSKNVEAPDSAPKKGRSSVTKKRKRVIAVEEEEEEDKETADAIASVEAFLLAEAEKEKEREHTFDSMVTPEFNKNLDTPLNAEELRQKQEKKGIYGPLDKEGNFSDHIIKGQAFVQIKSTFSAPSLVSTKHIFETLKIDTFKHSKDYMKRACLSHWSSKNEKAVNTSKPQEKSPNDLSFLTCHLSTAEIGNVQTEQPVTETISQPPSPAKEIQTLEPEHNLGSPKPADICVDNTIFPDPTPDIHHIDPSELPQVITLETPSIINNQELINSETLTLNSETSLSEPHTEVLTTEAQTSSLGNLSAESPLFQSLIQNILSLPISQTENDVEQGLKYFNDNIQKVYHSLPKLSLSIMEMNAALDKLKAQSNELFEAIKKACWRQFKANMLVMINNAELAQGHHEVLLLTSKPHEEIEAEWAEAARVEAARIKATKEEAEKAEAARAEAERHEIVSIQNEQLEAERQEALRQEAEYLQKLEEELMNDNVLTELEVQAVNGDSFLNVFARSSH
jgi:hypothetical protein